MLTKTVQEGGHPFFHAPVVGRMAAQGTDTPSPSNLSCGPVRTGGPYKKNWAKKSEVYFEKGVPCVEIHTKKGERILVSWRDGALATGFTWHVNKDGYAETMADGRPLTLHRLLMGKRSRMFEVDHRDMDKLNCTRSNIRWATKGQNAANRAAQKGGYKGVHYVRSTGKWEARMTKDGRRYYSFGHRTKEEAARAYDELARKHHGEFASLNFAGK